MTKVLIRGTTAHESVGVHAMAICTMEILKNSIPSCEFIMFSPDPKMDHKFYDKYNFNLTVISYKGDRKCAIKRLMQAMIWSGFKKAFNININCLLDDDIIKIIMECDIVIDMLGDGFSYDLGALGGNISPISHSLNILLIHALEKDLVLFPQSIGPFKNRFVKSLAKFSLNRTKAIVSRENISMDYLKEMGVKPSILNITGDTAFILKPTPIEKIKELIGINLKNNGKPLVGVNISQMLAFRSTYSEDKCNDYVKLMVRYINYLTKNLNATVILIPHALFQKEMLEKSGRNVEDDTVAINNVYKLLDNKNNTIPITNSELSAADIKGIIGQCDMFIGGRMHSVIAAISLCIPTIAISYSIKAPGIMNCVGLSEYVIDIKSITYEKLIEQTQKMWTNRILLHGQMISNVDFIKRTVWLNGELVKDILNSHNIPQK